MKKNSKNTPISFVQAVKNYWTGYINFNGTASRREYWYVWLFILMLEITVLGLAFVTSFAGILSNILAIIMFIPSRALAFRRLHDVGLSGWWYLAPYAILFPWIMLRSTAWDAATTLGYVPLDAMICIPLMLIAMLAYFIVLVQPSKTKDNPYRK